MDEPLRPAAHAFQAYTALPQVELLLEDQLGARGKLPLLGPKFRADYARYTPWVMLLFLPFHFLAVLLVLGVSGVATLLGHPSFLAALATVVLFALQAMALPGMFARSRRGWSLSLYGLALGTLIQLLRLSMVGLLFHGLFLWLAFQAKYEYR
ncbi:MAG TPA: hypothetical protein VFX59_04880 [Polyangiales bacterium]|nr:hypothetical protein [Polyangiales bacterium]